MTVGARYAIIPTWGMAHGGCFTGYAGGRTHDVGPRSLRLLVNRAEQAGERALYVSRVRYPLMPCSVLSGGFVVNVYVMAGMGQPLRMPNAVVTSCTRPRWIPQNQHHNRQLLPDARNGVPPATELAAHQPRPHAIAVSGKFGAPRLCICTVGQIDILLTSRLSSVTPLQECHLAAYSVVRFGST